MSANESPKTSAHESADLPPGWSTVNLFDVCQPKQWKTISTSVLTESGYPVYGANGRIGFYPEYNHEHPTILITCRGATCGTINVCEPHSYVNGNAMALDEWAEDLMQMEFAVQALRYRGFEDTITGSAQPQITRTSLQIVFIPLPPLAEQRRIVAKLELLLGKVSSIQQRLSRVPSLLKRFRQSVLAAACSGQLTADWREQNPSTVHESQTAISHDSDLPEIPISWKWIKLPDTGEMNRGKSRHRPRNEPSLYGGPYPFIQTGDIAQSGGRIRSHKQTYSEKGLAQSRLWAAGTVCITIAANIAESAILTYPACFPDSVVGIIANPEVCIAEFVEYFVRIAKDDLSTFAPATAQKNINIAILSELAVPLPPIVEQREIVRRVAAHFAFADQIEARLTTAQTHVSRVTQSLLARAFRGELVSTEDELAAAESREYESAESLLTRILAMRQDVVSGKPRKPRQKGTRKRTGRMRKVDREAVITAINAMPKDTFSFDDLRKASSANYAELKDVIFELLSSNDQVLKQYFDDESQQMQLVRGKK